MKRVCVPSLVHSRQRLVLVGCEILSSILRVEFAIFGRNLTHLIEVEGVDEHKNLLKLKLGIPAEFQGKKEGYQEHVFFDILETINHERSNHRSRANR